MINEPNCHKNPDKPTCIDLSLRKCRGSFQYSIVLETDPLDFHKMIVTLMKTSYRNIESRVINYWHYKSFSNEEFIERLLEN